MLPVQYEHYCCTFLQDNSTALHYAAEAGSNNVIAYLIGNGAGVNDVDNVSYDHLIGV